MCGMTISFVWSVHTGICWTKGTWLHCLTGCLSICLLVCLGRMEPTVQETLFYEWPLHIAAEIRSLEQHLPSVLPSSSSNSNPRRLKDTTPIQRGIIRHLVLVIDLSTAMLEKDLRPTRYLLTLRYVEDFIKEFFDQNPISQLGIIGLRDGLAVRVSDVGGNPSEHVEKVKALRGEEPRGQVSLQNGLEMGRGMLFHAPSHTTREILLLVGSLLSSDPSDIHTTISALVTSHITCTVLSLAAETAVLRTLVNRTNPGIRPEDAYQVPLDEVHYRELVMKAVTPPAVAQAQREAAAKEEDESQKASLLMMGFPSRISTTTPSSTKNNDNNLNAPASLCACHSKPAPGGYLCSRCSTKVCSLPTKCPACGLTLILSTHLARSYHHLFPLRNWKCVGWDAIRHVIEGSSSRSGERKQTACGGCMAPFPPLPPASKAATNTTSPNQTTTTTTADGSGNKTARLGPSGNHPPTKPSKNNNGISESGRYACETCNTHFCLDCDVFAHEVVHNCPGCQSLPRNGGWWQYRRWKRICECKRRGGGGEGGRKATGSGG